MCSLAAENSWQDPDECLVSFLCSANNNVSRIVLTLDRLRSLAGDPLAELVPARRKEMLEAGEPPQSRHCDDAVTGMPSESGSSLTKVE